jgi:hypothetical protein
MLFFIMHLLAGTVLSGVFVTVVVAVPALFEMGKVAIPVGVAAGIVLAIPVAWLVTRALWWLTAGPIGVDPTPLPAEATVRWTVGFFLFFTPLLSLLPCALAGRWLRPDAKTLALYMGVGYAMGCSLEMTIDPLWAWVVGRPLYLYHLAPIHEGHTSATGVVMWPVILADKTQSGTARLSKTNWSW